LGRRSLILALALAAAAAIAPASALGASISWIRGGNLHVSAPDGSNVTQLTRDGTADSPYQNSGQTNAGTLVGERQGWFYWLNRDGSNKSGPWLAPKGNLGTSPLSSNVAEEGGFVVYWHSYCSFACSNRYDQVAFMPEGPLTDTCNINCHDGYLLPRWIPGTPLAGMIDTGLNTVYAQVENSGPQEWFELFAGQEQLDIGHFDVSTDRSKILAEALSTSNTSAPGILVLLQSNGLPPQSNPQNPPAVQCATENFAGSRNGDPVWSPDGNQIAYTGTDGVHVSGAPVPQQDGSCALPGDRLVASGASNPEWGPVDAPGPTGGGGGVGAPAVTFSLAGRLPRLLRALNRGIPFFVRTNRAGRAVVRLIASGVFARGVSVDLARTKVVGRGARTLPRAGRYKVVAKFTRKAKRRYRRMRRVRLTARVTVRATGGGATTKRRRITLRR
jgi:hypothetical protein